MLTVGDFKKAIEKASELDHLDQTWPVYELYFSYQNGEVGTYFAAPAHVGLVSEVQEVNNDVDEVDLIVGNGDLRLAHGAKTTEDLKQYFLRHFRQAHDEALRDYLYGELSKVSDPADTARIVQLDEDGHPLLDDAGVPLPGPAYKNDIFNAKRDLGKHFEYWWGKFGERQARRELAFRPLRKAELFLHFAGLAEDEITQETVEDWVHVNGVLGLDVLVFPPNADNAKRGGQIETVAAFRREAEEAHWIKRLYEASLRIDDKNNKRAEQAARDIRELFEWSKSYDPLPQECKERAQRAVEEKIQEILGQHCQLEWRRAGNGLVEFPRFRTMLGAIYLQFSWLLRERANLKRCRFCGKPIPTEKHYRNREFCPSTLCKDSYFNWKKRRKREDIAVRFSVPPETSAEIDRLSAKRGMDQDAFLHEMLASYKARHELA